jgi:ferredoxin
MNTEIAHANLRLHIDWTRCDGRGLCTELLPGLLSRDEWGYPISLAGEPEPAIDSNHRAGARDAVRLCPRMALRLVDDSTAKSRS